MADATLSWDASVDDIVRAIDRVQARSRKFVLKVPENVQLARSVREQMDRAKLMADAVGETLGSLNVSGDFYVGNGYDIATVIMVRSYLRASKETELVVTRKRPDSSGWKNALSMSLKPHVEVE